MESLEDAIDYHFRTPELLLEALTHPSYSSDSKEKPRDNQRLEYLGDAVIQLIFTEKLFSQFPDEDEGSLTKRRSQLVSRDALSRFAMKIRLGDFLLLSKSEKMNQGSTRPSTLSDAFEALVGAIYLDRGLESAGRFVFQNFSEEINSILSQNRKVNPKGELQECLQAINPISPTYHIVHHDGPDHQKSFVAEVRWNGQILGIGSGPSKQAAEVEAAQNALSEQRWLSSKTHAKNSVKNS